MNINPQVRPEIPRLALCKEDAAAAIGISPRKLDQMVVARLIPFVRLGGRIVFPVEQLRQWLARQAEGKEVQE